MSDELSIDSKALIFATLADVYLTSGMLDEAISILKDGLARNPNYTLAKIILGRAYYMKGETEEALKLLEAIYPEAKDSENENLFLGHCYKRLADFDKARKHYDATLKINPENKEAKKELASLGAAAGTAEIKAATKKELETEKPAGIEAKPIVEIMSSDSSVPIKEVVLPEGDLPIVKEGPEPEMVIQEPTIKINVAPPVHETIDKEEIEIVLPVKGEDLTEEKPTVEVPVSWIDTKNEAEAIQKAEIIKEIPSQKAEAETKAETQFGGAEVTAGPEPAEEPAVKLPEPEKITERPPEIVAAEASLSDEVKKRIEALAAAGAQADEITKSVDEKLAEVSKQPFPIPEPEKKPVPVEEKPEPIEEIHPPEIKQKVEAIQKAEIPPTGETEPPPLFAEEMKATAPAEAPTEPTGTPFDRLNVPMEKLLSLKTVTASFISSRDGLLIKNYAEQREDIEEISALVAAIYNEAFESFKYLNEGPVEKIIIEKPKETICVITAGESLLCVITKPEAKPGLIFVYARKIIDEIREVLG